MVEVGDIGQHTHTHTHTHTHISSPIPYCPFLPAAAKSLQSCPTLCDPIDGSPPGSLVPGILQARILEWVAISFSNASRSVVSNSWRSHGLQPTRLLCPWDFPGKSTGMGYHCLLWPLSYSQPNTSLVVQMIKNLPAMWETWV